MEMFGVGLQNGEKVLFSDFIVRGCVQNSKQARTHSEAARIVGN